MFLHLFFTREGKDMKSPDLLYKAFMVICLSRILRLAKAKWMDLGSDVLYAISAKLLRRLRKLEPSDQVDGLEDT